MAQTPTAIFEQNSGSSTLATVWPGAQNLDLIQIVDNNGQSTLLNVDYLGAVHNPSVSPTNGTRIGVFQSTLSSTASTAQLFANAFANSANQDIIQAVNPGGNAHYYLDYLGVAHGS